MVSTPDYTTLYLIAGVALAFRVWNMLGGWPEAWYRIRRISYFVDYIRGPDKRFRKHVFKAAIIQHHSPAMFAFGRGSYLVPDNEASNSASGAPLWFHNWDDSRPIPVTLGKDAEFRERMPPEVIRKGFESKVAADIHRHGAPETHKTSWLILVAILVLVVLIMGVLYYDYNTYCATHPNQCGTGNLG